MKPKHEKPLIAMALAAIAFTVNPANAAVLMIGDKIGVDFGTGTTATNWNNFVANGTIAAGTVTNLAGSTLDDVTINLANAAFFATDGAANWAGLSTNGGTAPPEFVNAVTSDFAGMPATGMLVTFGGLNTALTYNINGVTFSAFAGTGTRVDTLTVTGDVSYGSSGILRSNSVLGAFHTFNSVSPDGSGTITVLLTEPGSGFNNGILNSLLITAVPEPSAALLGGLGLLALLRRRRS